MGKDEMTILGANVKLTDKYPNLSRLINDKEKTDRAVKDLFGEAVRSGEFHELIEQLADVYINNTERFIQRIQGEEIFIYTDDSIKLSIGLSNISKLVYKNKRLAAESVLPISNSRRAAHASILSEREVRVNRFVFQPPESLEVFESDIELRFDETRDLRPGEIYSMQPDNHIHVFEDPEQETLWASVTLNREKAPLVWLFDPSSMRSVEGISPDDEATRKELLLDVIYRLGYTDSVAFLTELAANERYHFVRWKALSVLLRMDMSAGIRQLEKAVTDNHPHVRKAAKATYENFRSAGLISQ